jgi:uncharacterized membrane protein
MLAALVALAGLFVAIYLTLYKLGVIGTLSCSVGSCETVQLSSWATLLGLPVAAWGVGYYAAVLTLTLVGVQERFADSRGISLALALLTGWGLLFSAWLTYLELFVIHAICRWCVASGAVILGIFILSLFDLRRLHRAPI